MVGKEMIYSDAEILIAKDRVHRMVSKTIPNNREIVTSKEEMIIKFIIEDDVELASLNLVNTFDEWFEVKE